MYDNYRTVSAIQQERFGQVRQASRFRKNRRKATRRIKAEGTDVSKQARTVTNPRTA